MRLRHRDTETEKWVALKFTKFPNDEKRIYYQVAERETAKPFDSELQEEIDYREHLIIKRYIEWFFPELTI